MLPIRTLVFGIAAGCTLLVLVSFRHAGQHDAGRPILDVRASTDHQWLTRVPELSKGLQFMEQRLLYIEVQIQELGRSHSTSTGLLLRPPRNLSPSPGRGLAETPLSSYKIAALRFSSAIASLPTEGGHLAEHAIDNDISTRVSCHKGSTWTGDLGKAVILFSISIDWETCDCQDDAAAKIEFSMLPSGPWQLYSNAGGFYTFGGHTQRSHVMMAEARYVRISTTETSKTGIFSIWEVYVKIETQSSSEPELTPPLVPGGADDDTSAPTEDDAAATHVKENNEDDEGEQDEPPPTPPPAARPPPSPPPASSPVTLSLFRSDNKCGKRVPPFPSGGPVQCNPHGTYPCCSALGWCGNTQQHCNCPSCVDYRRAAPANILPVASPLPPITEDSDITVAVIIPFRDRETHLTKFKPFWRWFAKEGIQPIKVKKWAIYIAEQFDSEAFNRGWNFNVGLAVASRQTSACEDITDEMIAPFRCAAIQDIDYLPEAGVDYSECEVPMQLSAEIDRYDWKTPYLQSAGGIVSMNLGHWQQVNGFSNDYFGWGGEDDEMHHRLRLTGLLHGDCYPFCRPNDPSLGKTGLSIKRPPKGKGRFSGKYMHSANHTKRITDHRAYDNNLKLLREIQSGQPRWKGDGLSNLAFRIVSYEKDNADAETHGITYHHVKVRRGRRKYNPKGISLAVSTSLCVSPPETLQWRIETLGEDMPWTLAGLRQRVSKVVHSACRNIGGAESVWNARSFILVDRRYHLAKLLSDENAALLVAFYRGLDDPSVDGLIIADTRSLEDIRAEFERVKARIHPPTEYTICTSKLGSGELKYSMHQGPACAGGWDKLNGGTFWAFTEKKEDMKTVTFCDNSRYWVQRMVEGTECDNQWAGLKWAHGGTFWVPKGNQFCVGLKSGGEVSYSGALVQADCSLNNFQHSFSFGSLTYTHQFGVFALSVGRKDGVTRISIDGHFDESGFTKELRFMVRLISHRANSDEEFCIRDSKGSEILKDCDGEDSLRFAVPAHPISPDHPGTLVCSGPSLEDPSQSKIGIGLECEDGPSKTMEARIGFRAPSPLDIAASVPMGGHERVIPFFTLVDEDVPCMGLFCKNVMNCAEHNARKSVHEPCVITA